MAERVNRRELIINTAFELFLKQGYATTSVRQIAEAVGVTEAALYYHFKDGKRELLREVFECEMPDMVEMLDGCAKAESFACLVHTLGEELSTKMMPRLDSFRWIMTEFPNMDIEEKALFHDKQMLFHNRLTEIVAGFVPSEKAEAISWLISLSLFGYAQMFLHMEVNKVSDFSPEDMIQTLSGALSAYIKT